MIENDNFNSEHTEHILVVEGVESNVFPLRFLFHCSCERMSIEDRHAETVQITQGDSNI